MKGRGTGSPDRSRGLTGLELLVLIAICGLAIAAGIVWEGHRAGTKTPSGIIPLSVATAERAMVVAGETYGYWVQDGTAGEVPVSIPPDPRPGIDAISIPVQLLVGGSPLDMDSLKVVVRSRAGTTALPRDESGLPGRSSWAVAGKTGVLPFQDADRDDLLEEPETFQILVLPPGPLDPGDHVTVTLSPPLGIALVVDRDIPGHVTPVTLLSL
jgi:archaellin